MKTFSYIPNHTNAGRYSASRQIFVQPKLTINNPGDQYEKEADAMADKVMRMEQPFIQAKPLSVIPVQRKCAHCEEKEKQAQRKEMNRDETTADHSLEAYVGGLNGKGQSLPGEVRNFYEPRFGYDFSNVKVHTDPIAAKSAQSINALAYTSGNNIVFNEGQYSPATESGKKLLGHELTHVLQQQNDNVSKKISRQISDDDGHNLSSATLAGDPQLEDCYDGKSGRYLRFGSTGDAVARLQEGLEELGYPLPEYGVDGIFKNETKNAVVNYQMDNGLQPDGIVGTLTISSMDAALSESCYCPVVDPDISGNTLIQAQKKDKKQGKKPDQKKGKATKECKDCKKTPDKKKKPQVCKRDSKRNVDFPNTFIDKVTVDLDNLSDGLTIHWNKKPKESDLEKAGPFPHSPGAGKCCVNCDDVATSKTEGLLCTPKVTDSVIHNNADCALGGHPTAKNPSRFDRSGIAIHAGVLPGYPASHGCVRTTLRASEIIHDNTVSETSTVTVKGTWKSPRCYKTKDDKNSVPRSDACKKKDKK